MITLKTEKNKRISQEEYDEEIKKLPIHQLRCPFCGHAGTMIKYGRYTRWVKVAGEMVQLRIQRVRCKECGATHAVVLTYIVPYQWERLEEQIEILQHWLRGEDNKEVMERNNLIDDLMSKTPECRGHVRGYDSQRHKIGRYLQIKVHF